MRFIQSNRMQRRHRSAQKLRAGKLLSLALIVALWLMCGSTYAQKVTISAKDRNLSRIVKEAAQQAGYGFVASPELLQATHPVSVEAKDQDITEFLAGVLRDQPVSYTIKNKIIILVKKEEQSAGKNNDGTTITGIVTGTSGEPLAGASVIVSGGVRASGTKTSEKGYYKVTIPAGSKTITFSMIGYKSQEVPLNGQAEQNVVLTATGSDLDEVVVIAYGKATRQSLTGSVASITAKDIEKRPISNGLSALEGVAPGIQVNNTYGQPGSTPSIRIRGFSSINGSNTPLYVVDGVIFGGSITDINPGDIASISVLKDAASSALYGNRASNGVIIITTKKAKSGAASMNVVMNQGIYNRGMKDYEELNPDEYMEAMWLGYRNYLMSSKPTVYTSTELANQEASSSLISDYLHYNIYDKAADQLFDANGKLVSDAHIRSGYLNDLNWYSPILQNGHRQDYTVSGGAHNEKSNLYFSTGYLDEKGFMKRSDFRRFTGRLSGDITPRTWVKAGFSINGSHKVTSNYSDGNTSYVNPIYFARNMAPIYPVHLHDSATGDYILDASGNKQYDDGEMYNRPQNLGRNSIWENELNSDKTYANTLEGQAFMDIKFLRNFTFTLNGDLNVRNTEEQTYDNASIGDGKGNDGRASRTIYRYKIYTFQQQLKYNKTFGLHGIDVLVGHENYNYYYSFLYGYKTTQTFAEVTDLINFTNITDLTDYQNTYRTESYLSRVRYNYSTKYYFDASFRRDGSSRFYSDNRWGNFWSVGGAWQLSNENFMQGVRNIFSDLKLRASYGEVGNDQSADYYAWMALYSNNQNANLAALYKNQNEAKNLQWETQGQLGVAVEGRLLNKINFSAEWFNKKSHKQIFDVNLPLSAGATSSSSAEAIITENIGDNYNRGWEFAANMDVLRTKDITWNIGANATIMKNRVTSLPAQDRENGIINGSKKIMIGHSIYDYWLYQYAGVDQMTGNALYIPDDVTYNGGNPDVTDKDAIPTSYVVEINGKYYTTNATYAKRDWSGSAIPTLYGAINTSFSWRNFTLSGIFTYSFGSKIIDYNYQSLMTMSGSVGALHKDILKSWNGVPDGMTETSANRIDPKGVPVIDYYRSQYTNATSTRFLQDGKYAVIKNITLNYNLDKSLVKKLDISNLAVYFSIENLATFTTRRGMDPQQSFDGTNYNYFMTPRVYSFGINIGL